MSYTMTVNRGTVTRDRDQKVVAPCDSTEDPDFLEYKAWVEAGNLPTEIYADDTVQE